MSTKTTYSATYSEKEEAFILRYVDYSGESYAHGGKYSYKRKQIAYKGFNRLSRRDRDKVMQEMLGKAEKLQEANRVTALNPDDAPKDAYTYFYNLEDVCTSTTPDEVSKARRMVRAFAAWLRVTHKDITLDRISTPIAIDYAKYLHREDENGDRLSVGTIQTHLARISYVMKRVVKRMEESSLKYRNGFADVPAILAYLEADEVFSGDIYTPTQSKSIVLAMIKPYKNVAGKVAESTRVFKYTVATYLAICTGWRINDILCKRWEDVDFTESTLFNIHEKTKRKSGVRTKVKLTAGAMRLISRLHELTGDTPYMFAINDKDPEKSPRVWYTVYHPYFKRRVSDLDGRRVIKRGKTNRSTMTIHSFRATADSALKAANYNDSIIQAYIGHKSGGSAVERMHYDKFTPDNFAPCFSYMEANYIPRWLYELNAVDYLTDTRKAFILEASAALAKSTDEVVKEMASIYAEAAQDFKLALPTTDELHGITEVLGMKEAHDELILIEQGLSKINADKVAFRRSKDKISTFSAMSSELTGIGLDYKTVERVAITELIKRAERVKMHHGQDIHLIPAVKTPVDELRKRLKTLDK